MRALFESYNELANGVLGALDVEMPRIDVSSLRSFATGPRRQPGPPQAPSEPGALPGGAP